MDNDLTRPALRPITAVLVASILLLVSCSSSGESSTSGSSAGGSSAGSSASEPSATTKSPAGEQRARICAALADGVNAGGQIDPETYDQKLAEAEQAAQTFLSEYPDSGDAKTLLEFARLMQRWGGGGSATSADRARARKLLPQVESVCNSGS